MVQKPALVPIERIENKILLIRDQKVIVDADLAELYGVTTKQLNQQVKRNKDRFPEDFMFQINKAEKAEVVTICDHLSQLKFSSSLPFAFTEHGAIMAASILNSKRAVETSVYVVRAFVKLREILSTHKELARKLGEQERKLAVHDQAIISIVDAIEQLMAPPEPKKKRPIGFRPADD